MARQFTPSATLLDGLREDILWLLIVGDVLPWNGAIFR
jgi:hypothetical protein